MREYISDCKILSNVSFVTLKPDLRITSPFLSFTSVFVYLPIISSAETNENNKEEDDLEIPAFLRRQKN